jgi:hypothetical protein
MLLLTSYYPAASVQVAKTQLRGPIYTNIEPRAGSSDNTGPQPVRLRFFSVLPNTTSSEGRTNWEDARTSTSTTDRWIVVSQQFPYLTRFATTQIVSFTSFSLHRRQVKAPHRIAHIQECATWLQISTMNPVAPVTSGVLLIRAVNYLCLCDLGLVLFSSSCDR